MSDFASVLLASRDKVGLSQAQLAAAAGLTPSYLSFIENRKKPPPSDDVCRRLAEALGIPAQQLIEVAHLERAPEPLRRRVQTLASSLKRERRSRNKLLERLLSPFLFGGPPGFGEGTIDALSLSPPRRRRIREVLRAVGRHHVDREQQVSKLVEALPERERQALLAALPELLKKAQGAVHKPPLFYAPPQPDARPEGPYLVQAARDGLGGEIRSGDLLLIDPAPEGSEGEIVLIPRGESGLLLRIERDDGGFRLVAAAGAEPEVAKLGVRELGEWLERNGAGKLLEIRRSFR